MCRAMGREDLASDPRFANLLSRRRHHDELDEIIRQWTAGLDNYDLMHLLQQEGVPAGPVLNGKDVHFDPNYQSRGFLERVTYPPERKIGTRPFIGRPYKFSKSPVKIQGPAPTFGQHNDGILKDLLGMDQAVYCQLVQDAIITQVPITGEAASRIPPEEAVSSGLLAGWETDYRERLGLE